MECIVVQDLFLNETAKYAHVFLPGSSFQTALHQRRAPHLTRAQGHGAQERQVGLEVTVALSNALGYPMNYRHPGEIMERSPGSRPPSPASAMTSWTGWAACGRATTRRRTARPSCTSTVRKGRFMITNVPTTSAARAAFRCCSPLGGSCRNTTSARRPAARPTSCGTARTCWRSTRRTPRTAAWPRRLGRHPEPRRRDRAARHADRPGPAGRGMHHLPLPESGANVVTTDSSDATNCPEYKVTAVQVTRVSQPSEWQRQWSLRGIQPARAGLRATRR